MVVNGTTTIQSSIGPTCALLQRYNMLSLSQVSQVGLFSSFFPMVHFSCSCFVILPLIYALFHIIASIYVSMSLICTQIFFTLLLNPKSIQPCPILALSNRLIGKLQPQPQPQP